ncbi:TPA: phage tail protein [Clostridioides difficile]|uniref:phage tail protein n=1 Tax=Clostridioides difficile TaxID=1496 RepID=UPI0010BB61EA|nr:phage tail protein [Clostridioides difficile]MCI9994854.1 phage tail protein [Clostridioides difficile]VHY35235.1 phage tail fiber protein [Clostridioides difficile]HBF5456095.1 phage tail protein [Clostridioides difficile]
MAQTQYYTLLTEIGKAAIANATALGTIVDFTKIKVGDGGGSAYIPTENQTELKNLVWESTLEHVQADEKNPNWVVIQKTITGDTGSFTIREVGIFDSKDQLLAISSYPETYKPAPDSGTVKEILIKIILAVSNTTSINLKIDPTVVLATLRDIQDLDTKIDTTKTELTSNIEAAKIELSNKIGDTTLLETTDKTSLVSALNEVKTSVDSIETTADKTSIKDTENLFTSDNVEGALKELVDKQNNLDTEVNGQRTKGITVVNNLIDMI